MILKKLLITSTHKHTSVDALNNCAYFYANKSREHFTLFWKESLMKIKKQKKFHLEKS